MATKRTPIKRDLRQRIGPEVIKASHAGDNAQLRRLLGLKPWEISPLDAVGLCVYPEGTGGAISWPVAQVLRKELKQAARE